MYRERGAPPDPARDRSRAGCALALRVLLLVLSAPVPALADAPVAVETESFRLAFAPAEPRILTLDVRATSVRSEPPRTIELRAPSLLAESLRGAPRGPDPSARSQEPLRYARLREERPDSVVVSYRAELPAAGCEVEHAYEIPRRGHELRLHFSVRGPRAAACARSFSDVLALDGRALEAGDRDAGFAGASERRRWVLVDAGESRDVFSPRRLELTSGRWIGVRNRYWAILLQAGRGSAALDGGVLELRGTPGQNDVRWDVRLYAGPVEHVALAAVAPELRGLLFAGRSPPIAWLAWLLAFAFEALLVLTGGAVAFAIVLLSLGVKAACHPIARLAERWQGEVDRTRALLEPELAEVGRRYRGEERSRRTFEVYRAHGVHPFYGLRSLLGVALQVPLFFAAYHMLDEHVALAGAGFLWIADLAKPDRIAALPFALPWLGDGLNLLPILMSAATLLASRLHDAGPLPPRMQRSRRRGLYALAAGFLLLFYTFPAGMVLYWTTNNLVSLLRAATVRLRRPGAMRELEVSDAAAR